MRQLTLRFMPEHMPDLEQIEALRDDLEDNVGPTEFVERDAQEGEKGVGLEVAALVVSLAGTPLLPALVDVLRSYLNLDRVGRVEVSGPGGTVKLKIQVGRDVSPDDIRSALEKVLGAS